MRQDVGKGAQRDDFFQVVSRKHFITKRDIRNIQVKVKDRVIIRHRNDAQSVSLAVSELDQEPYNLVKIKGTKHDKFPTLPADSFVLALQTEFQRDSFQKFGISIFCIDSTHGTNAYRYKLITCIVPDHYGNGKNCMIAMHYSCDIIII